MPTGLGDEKLWLCPSLDDSADDISGNGNHGTYNGGMGTVSDTSNGGVKAYSFDGFDDYIGCGEVVVTSGIGISLWMKRNEVSNFVSVVTKYDSSVGASSPFSPYYVMSSVSGNGIRGYVGTASTSSFKAEEYTSTVASNSWSHVAISCSLGSNKINIFIDGSFVTSNTLANSTFSSVSSGSGIKTLIGARQNSSSVERFLDGYLDDIRIFDRALTTQEITHLASSRGIEGNPYDYNGLGDEKLWLCPSLDDSADDISGNGNHGTYNGGMTTVADVSNGGTRAYSFDGVDDYIDLPTSGVSSSQNLNSFSLWVNPDSISSTAVIFNAGTASSGNRFINIGINSTGNIICGRSNDWLIAGSHTTSSWYHLCVVSNGTSISLYKDGSLIGSRTDAAVSYTETECRLGGFISNTNAQYDGRLDDLRVFDRALTTSEITALASKRGYEVPAAGGDIPHALSSPFHPLG